ncbi:MAG: hypothetical protein EU532_05395 [Promethearchaeota archaeon]|nr:MAG: hypothetical protein EU532_05395 [Candidatus Lokiarchaeota archaeon]
MAFQITANMTIIDEESKEEDKEYYLLEKTEDYPKLSQTSNYNDLESIFDSKIDQISSIRYFPQIYESSLQATYYALSIIDSIGKLEEVNQTAIFNYIMSCYNETSNLFMDNYAKRYLNTDFRANYYPLTSLLQVNCYAVLSLDILGRLDSGTIDISKMVQFMWDCYNPETGGFIGQKYSIDLCEEFKYSTMDNSYYAILALETLGDDFNSHLIELDSLVNFIQALQYANPSDTNFGGFDNSEAPFPTIYPYDPTLWSAYLCIKTLDILGLINTINMGAFRVYLERLYNAQLFYFKMGNNLANEDDFDIIGAAFGLQLADLTGYIYYEREWVIAFIFNNRNPLGLWNSTTAYNLYELIDTFQVIRALRETGEISHLYNYYNDETVIFDNIEENFKQIKGYSLVSKQYYSLELMHTIVRAFHTYGRIQELNSFFPKLYERIMYLYNYRTGAIDWYYFNGWINNDYYGSLYPELRAWDVNFRSRPLEFFSDRYHTETNEIGLRYSHKTSFLALDTLKAIFKLSYFHSQYDLSRLAEDIIDSQFLESSYPNYGGFVPNMWIKSKLSLDAQNDFVYLEYCYFAIKALELIAECMGEEDIANFGFNKAALYSYILSNIVETSSIIYYNPQYVDDTNSILQTTYQMIYLLKALNLYGLDNQKIKNFIFQSIDYTNIENIYFCYKISEILDLNIEFDTDLTQNLVETLYSEEEKEYFVSTEKNIMEQELFLWISEMAKNDDLKIDCDYIGSMPLGTVNTLTVSFCNIILDTFGPDFSVKFEESPFGTVNLEKQFDNLYITNFLVPINHTYYPLVEGVINIYEGFQVVGTVPVTIETIYELNILKHIVNNSNSIFFHVNLSYASISGPKPTHNSLVYMDIFKNGTYIEEQNFSVQFFLEFSQFTYNCSIKEDGNYRFNVNFVDDYHPDGFFLFETLFEVNRSFIQDPIPPNPGDNSDDDSNDSEEDKDDSTNSNTNDSLFYIGIIAAIGIITIISLILIVKSYKPGKKLHIERNIKNSVDNRAEIADNFTMESFFESLDELIEPDTIPNMDHEY